MASLEVLAVVGDPVYLPFVLFSIAAAVVLLLWLLPKWQAAQSEGSTAQNRFDRENESRRTLAQIIGGIFVLAGLYASIRTFDLQQQGQINERFTKAIDQLGAVLPGALDKAGEPKSNLEARLGGIYALQQIALDSPERYHWTIAEILAAYVRKNAPRSEKEVGSNAEGRETKPKVPTDVQAALTVIGTRNIAHDPADKKLDLSESDLRGADLRKGHFEKADFYASQLDYAHARDVHLEEADFSDTWLQVADLRSAHLEGAKFSYAHLHDADMSDAHLERAKFHVADLWAAKLKGAHLESADLGIVQGISDDNLTDSHVDSYTTLPSGAHPSSNWPK